MTSRTLALAAAVSLAVAGSPVLSQPAQAQSVSSAVATVTPIALWAITGAVLGAVAWPVITGGTAAAAPITSAGAFLNTGAAVGTVIGGIGYMMTR